VEIRTAQRRSSLTIAMQSDAAGGNGGGGSGGGGGGVPSVVSNDAEVACTLAANEARVHLYDLAVQHGTTVFISYSFQ
jgi:hypothetical protein